MVGFKLFSKNKNTLRLLELIKTIELVFVKMSYFVEKSKHKMASNSKKSPKFGQNQWYGSYRMVVISIAYGP